MSSIEACSRVLLEDGTPDEKAKMRTQIIYKEIEAAYQRGFADLEGAVQKLGDTYSKRQVHSIYKNFIEGIKDPVVTDKLTASASNELANSSGFLMKVGKNPLSSWVNTIIGGSPFSRTIEKSVSSRQMSLIDNWSRSLVLDIEKEFGKANFITRALKTESFRKEFYKAAFNEQTTSKEAMNAAKIIRKTYDKIVTQSNTAGADIWRLKNGLHSPIDVRKMTDKDNGGVQGYVSTLSKLNIDWDESFGGRLKNATTETRMMAIEKSYKQQISGSSKLVSSKNDFLDQMLTVSELKTITFKDSDSFVQYYTKYGDLDPMRSIYSLMQGSSMKIATIETLGMNPEKNLINAMTKAASDNNMEKYLDVAIKEVEPLIDALNQQTGGDNILFNIVNGINQATTARFMGSSVISSITDIGKIFTQATKSGRGAFDLVGKMISRPLAKLDKDEFDIVAPAVQYGMARYNHDIFRSAGHNVMDNPVGLLSDVANAVLKLEGVKHYDDFMMDNITLSISMMHAQPKASSFAKLAKLGNSGKNQIATLKKYEITDKIYEAATQYMVFQARNGDRFIIPDFAKNIPDDVAKSINPKQSADMNRQEIANSWREYMFNEAYTSQTKPKLADKLVIEGQSGQQNLTSLLRKIQFQFMTFTLVNSRQMLAGKFFKNANGEFSPMITSQYIGGALLAGHVVNNIKSMIKGEQPEELFSEDGTVNQKRAYKDMIQSGVGGLYGDVLFGSLSKASQGNILGAATSTSPTGQVIADSVAMVGNLAYGLAGNQENLKQAKKGLGDVLDSITPAANLWYTKAGVDAMFLDDIRTYFDENYRSNKARRASSNNIEKNAYGEFLEETFND